MNESTCVDQEMSPMGKTLELLGKAIERNQDQANLLRDCLKMLVKSTETITEPTAEKRAEPNRCGLDDRLTGFVNRLNITHGILQAVLDGLQI